MSLGSYIIYCYAITNYGGYHFGGIIMFSFVSERMALHTPVYKLYGVLSYFAQACISLML